MPPARQQGPEGAVAVPDHGSGVGTMEGGRLLAQGQVFQDEARRSAWKERRGRKKPGERSWPLPVVAESAILVAGHDAGYGYAQWPGRPARVQCRQAIVASTG